MKFTLQFKILSVTILVIFLAFLASTFLSLKRIKEISQTAFRERATVLTQALDASIGSRDELTNQEKLQSTIYKTIWLNADIIQISISLPTPEGFTIIASNDNYLIGSKLDIEKNLFEKESIVLTETEKTPGGTPILEALAPISIGGQQVGIYNIKLSLADEEKAIAVAQKESLLIALTTTFVIIGILSLSAQKLVIQPIKKLQEGAKIIGAGNFAYKLNIITKDEIGDLAQSFNEMAKQLRTSYLDLEEKIEERTKALQEAKSSLETKVKARTRELSELTETLEERVKQRTKELQEKVKELERFQKLTVGRELKMVELKKALRQAQVNAKNLEKKT